MEIRPDDTIRIEIDFDSVESIKKAEKQKAILENEGFSLISTNVGIFTTELIYKAKKIRQALGFTFISIGLTIASCSVTEYHNVPENKIDSILQMYNQYDTVIINGIEYFDL